MRRTYLFGFYILIASICVRGQQPQATPTPAPAADDKAAMEQRMRDLEDRIVALEGELRQLKAQGAQPAQPPAAAPAATPSTEAAQAQGAPAQPAVPQPAPAPTSQAEAVRLGGAGGAASKALNPDISMIGDFIASAGHNPVNPTPSFQMHEAELGVQAIVDPYARGDFFISFGEQGVELEEGYLTFTALPASFVVKAGKMRAAFGKVNTMHNHVLPWVDRPLVTQNLVGGEDGIDDAGVSVQHIIPAPAGWFLEGTGQVYRGDSSDVFTASNKNDVSVVGHLRSYKDLTENTNVDIGASYSRGHNVFGSPFITQLYGIDATLRWKPLQRSIYHSFVARSEFIWRQQNQPVVCTLPTCPAFEGPGFQRSFGFYTSADYQLGRRWFVGARVDRSDRAFNSALVDNGGSLVLTYLPSEFVLLRSQYRLTRYAENFDAHEAFVQLQFALGAHGAHPF